MSMIKENLRTLFRSWYGAGLVVATVLFAVMGCDGISGTTSSVEETAPNALANKSASGTAAEPARPLEAAKAKGIASFRRATAKYHRVDAALDDGFERILPCLSNPDGDGAIGIPYARLDRFDATVDLSEPEILFYEPQPDGSLKLVGGEPVVPISVWTAETPPSLFGREFHRNEEHGLFGLHMWIWRHNPDGVFAFWNLNVSCEMGR